MCGRGRSGFWFGGFGGKAKGLSGSRGEYSLHDGDGFGARSKEFVLVWVESPGVVGKRCARGKIDCSFAISHRPGGYFAINHFADYAHDGDRPLQDEEEGRCLQPCARHTHRAAHRGSGGMGYCTPVRALLDGGGLPPPPHKQPEKMLA